METEMDKFMERDFWEDRITRHLWQWIETAKSSRKNFSENIGKNDFLMVVHTINNGCMAIIQSEKALWAEKILVDFPVISPEDDLLENIKQAILHLGRRMVIPRSENCSLFVQGVEDAQRYAWAEMMKQFQEWYAKLTREGKDD